MRDLLFSACMAVCASSALAQVGPMQYNPPSKIVFPHIVTAGGWETDISLVNMDSLSNTILLTFYSESGSPMDVTMKPSSMDGLSGDNGHGCYTQFSGDTATGSAFCISMFSGGSFQAKLTSTGDVERDGWARISYTAMDDTIGGYETFRRLGTNGLPDFEASVPLSYTGDWEFCVPFDNRNGFVTAMAMVNPTTNGQTTAQPITVRVLILKSFGGLLTSTDSIQLAVGEHRAFIVNDLFPQTRDTFGVLFFRAQTGENTLGGSLSALGLRFNPKGAFATIPILNYYTMYNGVHFPN